MADNLDDAIAELTATEADENAAASALVDAYAAVPQRIADAVEAAKKVGATATQLSALSGLKSQISTEADKMKAALAVTPPA